MAHTVRHAVLTVGTLIALVGCSTSSGTADPADPPSRPSASTPVSPPSPRPSKSPATPTPSASASPSSTAPADGTRLSACGDGQCEVSVGEGAQVPVPERAFGTPVMNVTRIEGDETTLEWRRTDGSRSTITLFSPGGLSIGGYELTVTVRGKRAVLRMAEAAAP
ncbi:hypothetical protein SLINC_1053 [Streptomyces lincolnensis]|uniref:Uncharacterized protein n=1 Tax=Streptomyces lincolnensis TaxID=1915 RepID=A0A1B1M4B4_STRLN|nr:hypothetical protein [Streptomyces lincolnensis]ANS63277.1 hypothetical protein SLINC_1053 [Streptomyces lincolnensis]QMV05174.1 hypothetical protein GJU35_05575 [Streptomyces lincolnensis]